MEVKVFYRGALGKLHRIDVATEDHAEAVGLVGEALKDEPFAQKPVLALIEGGKQ